MRRLAPALVLPLGFALAACPASPSAKPSDAGADGGCSVSCGFGLRCQAGICGPITCTQDAACPSLLSCVSGYCADDTCNPTCNGSVCIEDVCITPAPLPDAGCSAPCALGLLCIAGGTCAPQTCLSSTDCPPPLECLSGYCADQTCDPPCGAQVCLQERCYSPIGGGGASDGGLSCSAGYVSCPSSGGPACVNLQTDPQSCGTCGQACPNGEACRARACVASCGGVEAVCTDAGECCSGACNGAFCCQDQYQGACARTADCCNATFVSGSPIDNQTTCQAGLCCLDNGLSCLSDDHCCSLNCAAQAGSPGVGQCCPLDSLTNGAGPCATSADCCPGVCQDGGCCAVPLSTCDYGAECCLGSCENNRCCVTPGGLAIGSPCDAGAQCCQGGCAAGQCCVLNGQVQASNEPGTCCSGTATASGVCCGNSGTACRAFDECCGGDCVAGGCT